jgi:cytochrome c oxidase cbb3-type subunit 3
MKNNLKYIGLLAGALLSAPSLMAANSTSSDTQSMVFGLFVLMAFILVILLFVLARIIKSLTANKDLWVNQIKSNSSTIKATVLAALFALSANSTFAQGAAASEGFKITSGMFDIIITLNVILLVFVFALVIVLRKMINALRGEEQEETTVASDITHILTDAVPVEREHEIMTDHDYDGIKELDNNLPPWWVWGFYMTIVFAFVYIYYYHFSGSNWTSKSEYQIEMADAAAAKEAYMSQMANSIDESSVTILTAEADLSAG